MTSVPAYEIEACYDCTAMHCNGDTGGNVPDREPWSDLPDADVSVGSVHECNEPECEHDRTEFSTAQCGACGSTLAGYRHTFTVWEKLA